MRKNNFIITLTGPSQSGKTLVMDKIIQLKDRENFKSYFFCPKKIKKYTTRYLRLHELAQIECGKDIDVEFSRRIPDSCDLVYQTYGIRYGLCTENLRQYMSEGLSPVIVINDIRAVEEIKSVFPGQVLSLFLFRKIPKLEDFKEEAKDRGNVSEQEILARYDKAVAIYRTYIENISLFDHVILNAIEYDSENLYGTNTILDSQIENVILPILNKKKCLCNVERKDKKARIFVISGNAASGKDEIIRALLSMGKLEAKIIPKYTTRQQEPEDGKEMICKYIPKNEILLDYRKEYIQQIEIIKKMFLDIDKSLSKKFKQQFIDFKQRLEENILDEYQRFWDLITIKAKTENENGILSKYFQLNPEYIDLNEIKKNAEQEFCSEGVAIYNIHNRKYIIYGQDDRLYGCDITDLQQELNKNKQHFVISASEVGFVQCLKYLYRDSNVKFIYAHSEISASEFEAKALDTTKTQKIQKFSKVLRDYTKYISDYDHVTIYAKSRLTYEQTSKEEELVDQMFRLLRAY